MAQLLREKFFVSQNLCCSCISPHDSRLFADDLDVSKAYTEALRKAGCLTNEQCSSILAGLELVRYDWIEGLLKFSPTDKDVHTINKRRLTEIIGEVGQYLNSGCSRNEQVLTAMKLWLRKAINELLARVQRCIEAILEKAEHHLGVLMPASIDLQRAQAVQFSHWLLSYAWILREDYLRLKEQEKLLLVSPLGSGTVAGNPFHIDRVWLAKRLGFTSVTTNSLHAVADNDFMAEEFIIYSTKEFDFLTLSEPSSKSNRLESDSSSMELVRGASVQICACLTGIMMTTKNLRTSCHKDWQYDKRYCFETFDALQGALKITASALMGLKINPPQMEAKLCPEMLAADWYIENVIAFAKREFSDIIGIPLGELQNICPYIDRDIANVADFRDIVEQYDVTGGTASASVQKQINLLKEFVTNLKKD
uniref:Fumarate lyase N-terminal domain-containing protein n=1 Tax=Glossina palpalis gambiensis TaxID=67801 RepID=A0A1B0B295_9MUSC